jgi:uncharacterized protein YegP (UPF0339 family)
MDKPDGIEIYQGITDQWYWRLRVKGRIKADGSEGYASKSNVKRALKSIGLQLLLSRTREIKIETRRGARHG